MKADVGHSGGSSGSADRGSSRDSASGKSILGSRLFIKYVALFVSVVVLALVANGAFEVWFSFQEQKAALTNLQHQQAEAAADKIEEFVTQIQSQLGWTTQLPWTNGTLDQRRFDALRLLRQVPAITELAQIDASGHEQLKVSRLTMDVVGSGIDYSDKPEFKEAMKNKVYYGPVYFRRESEPYMTIALAGARVENGVSIAQVNLKLIWDVVSGIKVGENGHAYVVDGDGRLIAHPDISLVLRNTDMSKLAQVQAARAGGSGEDVQEAEDLAGHKVLTAHAQVHPLGWFVFVETPIEEAYAPLYRSVQRSGYVLFGALLLAFIAGAFLARRMVVPIQALRAGAARIGAGDLGQRIDIETGDEVEALANQFNEMAGRLQESYADLEKKVEDRTADLTEALAQQTATSEVLRVISSSPGELEPVFHAILANATRICEAKFGVMHLHKDGQIKCVAELGAPAVFAEFLRHVGWHRPQAGSFLERVLQTKRTEGVVHDGDEKIGELPAPPIRLGGARTLVGVPMVKEGELVGAIVIYRQEVRPFTEKQIALVENFAAQAVIAIENARLLSELRESLAQQTATSDVLRVISSSPGDLKPVFESILDNATRICQAEFGTIYRYDSTLFHMEASHGEPTELLEFRKQRGAFRPPSGQPLDRMLRTNGVVHSMDDAAEPVISPAAQLGGARSHLAVPMFKEGALVGAITIYRTEVRPFADKQIELVKSFAAQAVIAIENTRLLTELRQRTEDLTQSLNELRTAQDRLVQTEKLASLGQLTAGIAHEIKNPLNFVNNFSSVSVELIDELQQELAKVKVDAAARAEIDELAETLKGNLDKIVQHGKRADSIVKNMLLHSRSGSGEHRPVDVNALVEESLNLAYHGARAEKQGFNITLDRAFDPAAGEADLYPQEVTRVLLNLISNGFYAAHKRKTLGDGSDFEPKLSAATKDLGDRVEITIRDNGTGIPLEVKEKMFNPFFTTKPAGEGTGLGLSISHDIIVKQHAGTIGVDTEPGKFTEFRIVLPRNGAALGNTGGRA
ncbi:MAG TPA: GAF domain-containing protein [Xanthobacteraceae bacterium]|jgi:signal transduction histidine kinase|nr:GAF domain-containing protein [Xanthobacteraceae bacterium]